MLFLTPRRNEQDGAQRYLASYPQRATFLCVCSLHPHAYIQQVMQRQPDEDG